MPTLHFLGWERPTIELVAEKLEELNRANPSRFRRATVVVPTAESGRRLREYMAERAGKPLLMPRLTLAGQLIPTDGPGVATEAETLAAWLQVLSQEEYHNLLPHSEIKENERWLLDTVEHLRKLRLRLEKENCPPERVAEQLTLRSAKTGAPAALRVLTEENRKWLEMSHLFSAVDACLNHYGLIPREQVRTRNVAAPTLPGNGNLLIVACVPELSQQLRNFLLNLQAEVQIWVNAPEEERAHFDEWGQPEQEHWSSRSIEIPHALEFDSKGKVLNSASTLHLTDDGDAAAAECVRLVHEALSRHTPPQTLRLEDEIVISCCDSAFTPRLHAAFRMAGGDDWELNLPEGRSLLTMDAAHLFGQLAAACRSFGEKPVYDEQTKRILHNDMSQPEAFCTLLRNRALMRILPEPTDIPAIVGSFVPHLESLLQSFLPGSASRLLYLLNPQQDIPISRRENNTQYNVLRERRPAFYRYALNVAALVQSLNKAPLPLDQLRRLGQGLSTLHHEHNLTDALQKLSRPVSELAEAPFRGLGLLNHPLLALEYLQLRVEQAAAGVLPETQRDNTELDVPGWKEISYYRGRRVIINAMHDGCVPEPFAQEELLPESLCRELGLQHSRNREARDAFLLTALLHSRPQGEVHFVLSAQSADGSPLSASTLLLRCGNTPEGLLELARRAHHLFADNTRVKLPPEPELCPLRKATLSLPTEKIEPGQMEELSTILLEGEVNPFTPGISRQERCYSPSTLAVFLECPLTFWIKNALQIDPSDNHVDNKMEPQAAEYGTGMHAVLDKLVAEFPSYKSLTDNPPQAFHKDKLIEIVAERAEKLADKLLRTAYAEEGMFTLPMQAHHSIMKRTLRDFARHHVQDLSEGWCNVARELKVAPRMGLEDDNSGESVGFNMTIDRVDFNINTGQWRVLDYKTSAEAKEPRKVHYEEVPQGEQSVFHRFMNYGETPSFPLCTAASKSSERHYRWRNVQLPLYTYALQQLTLGELQKLLTEQQQLPLSPELESVFSNRAADTPLFRDMLPEMGYCSLATKTQEVSYHSLMNHREIRVPRQHFYFPEDTMQHYNSALRTVRSAVRLIRHGLCLYSAVALELKKKPYAQYGALAPSADPREIFSLPELNK